MWRRWGKVYESQTAHQESDSVVIDGKQYVVIAWQENMCYT